jgi:hypothetical protein
LSYLIFLTFTLHCCEALRDPCKPAAGFKNNFSFLIYCTGHRILTAQGALAIKENFKAKAGDTTAI